MPFKIVFEKEIHIYKGDPSSFTDLQKFIQNYQKQPFQIFYKDCDGDNITISCDQDLKAIQNEKNMKIYVQQADKELSEDFNMVEKQDSSISDNFVPLNDTQPQVENKEEQNQAQSQEKGHPFKQLLQNFLQGNLEQNIEQLPKWCKKLGNLCGNQMGEKKKLFQQRRQERIKAIVDQQLNQKLPVIAQYVEKYLKGEIQVEQKPLLNNSEKQMSENLVVHDRYICDGCEAKPIIGVRYQCSVCEDFDFCEKCEATKEHPHPFLKIKNPEQAVKAIFCCVNEQPLQPFLQHLQNVQFPNVKEMVQEAQKQSSSQQDFYKNVSVDIQQEKPKKEAPKKPAQKKVKGKQGCKKVAKKVQIQEPVYTWTVQNKANQIHQALGGELQMYLEIANAMPDASVEEICEMILLQPVVSSEPKVQENVQKVVEQKKVQKSQSKPNKPKPVEKKESPVEIKKEESQPVVVKKEEPKVQQPSQKIFSQNVKKNAIIVASNLGGNPEDFYEIVDTLSFYQSPSEILELIISDREAQKQLKPQKNNEKSVQSSTSTTSSNSTQTPKEIKKEEKKPEVQKETQKEETPTEQQTKQTKDYSQSVVNKAKIVSQALGGKFEDYLDTVECLGSMNVQEIVEVILAQRENDSVEQEKQKKIKEEQEKKKAAEIKNQSQNNQKKLKKNYPQLTQDKAQKIAEVMGGNKEQYYELVENYVFSGVNDLVELLLSDPTILSKHSSFV